MSEPKHTPLPWKRGYGSFGDPYLADADGVSICEFMGARTMAREDTDFALLACNSHYDLLERLAGHVVVIGKLEVQRNVLLKAARQMCDALCNARLLTGGMLIADAHVALSAAIAKTTPTEVH